MKKFGILFLLLLTACTKAQPELRETKEVQTSIPYSDKELIESANDQIEDEAYYVDSITQQSDSEVWFSLRRGNSSFLVYDNSKVIGMSKRDQFVNKVAKEVLNGLSDKDKEYIYMNPNSVAHHFGLGLMIRNKYIYNNDNEYVSDSPDNLSSIIVSKIASMIIENYDYKNPMCRWLYDSFEFPYYRKLYFVVNNKFPDEIRICLMYSKRKNL